MKTICFLREIGLPIKSIGELLSEEDPGSVVSILPDQQEQTLHEELNERQTKAVLTWNLTYCGGRRDFYLSVSV